MGSMRGAGRHQTYLLPATIDEYIGEEPPVRVWAAFVERLAREQVGFGRATAAATGRPGEDPGDLVRRSPDGSLHRMRSRRRLAKDAARNLALMGLLGKRRPACKPIADCRRDNGAAIKQVGRELTLLCKELALVGGERSAIDGGQFQAVNGQKRNVSGRKLGQWIEELDAKVAAYLQQLDGQDAAETPLRRPTAAQRQQQLEPWQERQPRSQCYQQQLQPRGAKQISLTAPASRQLTRGDGRMVGYTVQVAVDENSQRIVAHDVPQAVPDQQQLAAMAARAKQTLGAQTPEVVADRGYDGGADVQKGDAQGVTGYLPQPQTSANPKLGLFGKEGLTYHPEQAVSGCPAGEPLTYRFGAEEEGGTIRYDSTAAWGGCAVKARCTRHKANRRSPRWESEDVLERLQHGLENHPEMMLRGQASVEPPLGTIKRWMAQGYFLMRGELKVRTEMRVSLPAYQIKRVLSILGVKTMREALA
jgi:transposase